MLVSAALIFWESRDNAFFNDELLAFQELGEEIDPETILAPRNGHLIAVSNLLYGLVFSTIGPEYIVFRIIEIAGLLALSALLFAYAKRRVGPALALAPAVVILFLGAAWETILWPYSIATFGVALAAGIGALMALDRRDRRGDVTAFLLLLLSVASVSVGLTFVLGVAVAILLAGRGWRTLWIPAVPLVLWGAWWLWAMRFDEASSLSAVNLWLIPAYMAESLAVVLAAVTGLGATLAGEGLNPTVEFNADWGIPLAVIVIVAFAVRLSRGHLPIAFWATLAALASYWALAALSLGPDRGPNESRYILPGAILVFVVAANALTGVRLPRAGQVAVVVVVLISVATGIRQLHDGEIVLRDYSLRSKAILAGIERAEGSVADDYAPVDDPELSGFVPSQFPVEAGPYLEGVESFGSPAFSDEELAEQNPLLQGLADKAYRSALASGAG
jgi:hypothetical protein